jgi:rubredoxin
MNKCKNCGNEIPKRNVFCNNSCQKQYENKTQIEKWLNGESIIRKGGTTIPQWMRNYLLNESGHKCTKCGWNEINPYTNKSPLDIDHIDGDAYNNLKDNLRVLCPNCHSLEKTFKNVGNRKSTRNYRNKLG